MNQMSNYFSVLNREEEVKHASGKTFDLIIIGGGITGAGIALDAASRGLSVLLLEKSDFASGTSSKSTKLIHGGLRYLKQFEIGLVRETGTERAVVHKLAPQLVHPEKMLLPIVKNGTFGKLSASIAISIYDLLAGVQKEDKKKTLSRKATIKHEPMLRRDILKSGIEYSEYRTDDARLTLENIKAAHRNGATVFNYSQVDKLLYTDGKVSGVEVNDEVLGTSVKYGAKHVVSAAGPWVDLFRKEDNSLDGSRLRLTKGVHLVFDKTKLPLKQAIYFDAFDGRMLFAIPRGKVTYVGTSDTDYNGDKNRVVCTKDDVEYILNAINFMIEVDELEASDVISSWAGLRPLIQEEGKSPSELSRKDEIFESDSGFVSIAGGKLTGYRKMAERILDLLQERDSNLPQNPCKTDSILLAKTPIKNYDEVKKYISEISLYFESIDEDKYYGWYLVSNYGRSADLILDDFKNNRENGWPFEKALIKAEIDFCINYESTFSPDDFFNRRTGMLYFDPKRLQENLTFIHECFSNSFNWNLEENNIYMKQSQRYINDAILVAVR